MNLNFQNSDYSTPEQEIFKEKMIRLENQILDDAFANRVKWFDDDDLSREVIKSKFYPIIKYPKVKGPDGKPTKKLDMSKPPSVGLKVTNYDNKWGCEVYDMEKNKLFPNDDPVKTPCDYVQKKCQVIAKFQVSAIWTGDKAWGVKLALVLCFVQPNEDVSQFDVSDIALPMVPKPAKNANSLPDDEDEADEEDEELGQSLDGLIEKKKQADSKASLLQFYHSLGSLVDAVKQVTKRKKSIQIRNSTFKQISFNCPNLVRFLIHFKVFIHSLTTTNTAIS
jgi:hypothetical protein